jgi:hypothetical protein
MHFDPHVLLHQLPLHLPAQFTVEPLGAAAEDIRPPVPASQHRS